MPAPPSRLQKHRGVIGRGHTKAPRDVRHWHFGFFELPPPAITLEPDAEGVAVPPFGDRPPFAATVLADGAELGVDAVAAATDALPAGVADVTCAVGDWRPNA